MNGPQDLILVGDALARLRQLPDESVQVAVTSPPYWGLRDYGVGGQLGLERTPDQYVQRLVEIFRELRRVLRSDGLLWIVIGDCYAGSGKGRNADGRHHIRPSDKQASNRGSIHGVIANLHGARKGSRHGDPGHTSGVAAPPGLKPKDLVGVPWTLAFALRNDGWWLRSDNVWAKPNGMTESVEDRTTRVHEYVFMFSKSRRYFYDFKAVVEPQAEHERTRRLREQKQGLNTYYRLQRDLPHGQVPPGAHGVARSVAARWALAIKGTKNRRSVWSIATTPSRILHFATFPRKLAEICIRAGSREGDVVLDPFMGSGTTALVAQQLGRHYVGIELNPRYVGIARRRIANERKDRRQA